MKKYGYVHNDIKPENLTVILEDLENTEKKNLRFIDLGLANDTLQCSGFTVRYFMSPMRRYLDKDGIKIPIFSDFDEKYRNEMFTVFRTIQDLMITN